MYIHDEFRLLSALPKNVKGAREPLFSNQSMSDIIPLLESLFLDLIFK